MKLTKYAHACLVLEQHKQAIVIDPGNFSDDFEVPDNVLAVLITHQHADHCDPGKLRAIIGANPQATVYGLGEVTQVAGMAVSAVQAGDELDIGTFHIEFVGGAHATIHSGLEPVGNVGIVVNRDQLYYPGDSFTPPPRQMNYIAVPVAAPWLKISETVDFLRAAAPAHAFPTHDAILSAKGKSLVDRVVSNLLDDSDVYTRIKNGETIEL